MKKNNIKRISILEKKYINEVLKYSFRSSKNSLMTKKFENEFARIYKSKYAISFVNGTATMHACLEALNIGVGDEVIVPPLTMASTSMAVLHANATPVYADVDPDTFLISPEEIEKKINSRTKAIITVSLYGLSPQMDKIKEIAKKKKIFIIEDNAEAFLSFFKNKLVGKFGDFASFSFQSSKHLTSGEGGVVITDNKKLANNLRRVQSLGYSNLSGSKVKIDKDTIQHPSYARHSSLGWNYRMPDLCSAVAYAQCKKIKPLVNQRIKVGKLFSRTVKKYESWFKEQFVTTNCKSSYWCWTVKLETKKVSWEKFRQKFIENGGHPFYAAWKLTYLEPMFSNKNLQHRENFIRKSIYRSYKKGLCPVAEEIQPKLLQFKTNYWNFNDAVKQAKILKKTLDYFN